MRVRTLEIRWHDSKPINSCDFQPLPPKKARPANERDYIAQSYRLATAGEDNNVRVRIYALLLESHAHALSFLKERPGWINAYFPLFLCLSWP